MAERTQFKDREYLTRTEIEVLKAKSIGLTSQEVAEKRGGVKRTVDFHLRNAYRVLGARGIVQALNEARRRGLIE